MRTDEVRDMLPRVIGRMRLNVRSGEVCTPDRTLSANQIDRLYLELSKPGQEWPKDITADAVIWHASRDPFDPIQEYLEGITADPLPVEQWRRLDRHLLGIDNPRAAESLGAFFVTAVSRVYNPGCLTRQIPVLVGPTCCGKTALGKILFGADYWLEGANHRGRNALMMAHRAWGVELAGLDNAIRQVDQKKLKGFLSETTDTFRRPFDQAPERHHRRFVFWGTSNSPLCSIGSTHIHNIHVYDRLPTDFAHDHRDAIWRRALLTALRGIAAADTLQGVADSV